MRSFTVRLDKNDDHASRLQARRGGRRQNFQERSRLRNLALHSMEVTPDDDFIGSQTPVDVRGQAGDLHYRGGGSRLNNAHEALHDTSVDDLSPLHFADVDDPPQHASQIVSAKTATQAESLADAAVDEETSSRLELGSADGKSCHDNPGDKLFAVQIDHDQNDRASEIPLFSTARPHMRAFHLAWVSFGVAFFAWFSIVPLLSEIQYSLSLSRKEIWTSSILAIVASAITRVAVGPLIDKYGSRWIMSATLVMKAIPLGLSGLLIQSASSLYWTRFMIGIAGSAFVSCQSWISAMFTVEIAGTAQALAAGWANIGGGLSQVVMGSLLFPLFKIIYGGDGYNKASLNKTTAHDDFTSNDRAAELAWRTILVFPALLCLIMAYVVIRYSDDTPQGNVAKLRKEGSLVPVSAMDSLRRAASTRNTWLLAIQYGCCFGVEVAITQVASLYFQDEFGQTTESAAAIASAVGWVNLFARAAGGFVNDVANVKFGMRGRMWVQVVLILIEGICVIAFSHARTLVGAIFVLILLSIFVSASAGSTFAIVPYVDFSVTGSISGFVAAGGSTFAVFYSILFLKFDYHNAILWMGCSVLASAFLTVALSIRGYRGLLTGEDSLEVQQQRRTAELPSEITIPREE
ncbi:hypothetical protein MPSEU_000266600 [Mayamaea pseudoterrestris]|nr:hypothetical protein MPSEU_000266600 [Mayamaea pseudoterrestris]